MINIYFIFYFQLDQCTQLCDNIEKKYPDLIEDITLLKAVMLWRQNKNSEAIDLLKKFIYQQKNPTAKLNCTLVAVKLLLMQVKSFYINNELKLML